MAVLVDAAAVFVAVVVVIASVLHRLDRAFNARIAGAATANGVVVGFENRHLPGRWIVGDSSGPLRMAQVRFTTSEGRDFTFTANIGTSLRPKVGRDRRSPASSPRTSGDV